MGLFYLKTIPISRSKGRSATAAAAYRTAEKIVDERTGIVHDYTRKSGVLDSFLFNNSGLNSSDLWNLAEQRDNRSNSRVAREFQVALPYNMSRDQHYRVLRSFSESLINRYGCAVEVAIHAPSQVGDHRNIHAHIMLTTRAMNADGTLGDKTALEMSDANLKKSGLPLGKTQVKMCRAVWARCINSEFRREGNSDRVDHRSNEDRGIDRIPGVHIGPQEMYLARMGYKDRAHRWQLNELVRRANNVISIYDIREKSQSKNLNRTQYMDSLKPHSSEKKNDKKTTKQSSGLAGSAGFAKSIEKYTRSKLSEENEDVSTSWRPVVIDADRGQVITMFKCSAEGVYSWGGGRRAGLPAFSDTGDAIYSQSMSEWAIAAELELTKSKIQAGEWSEAVAFGDEEYRRRVWLQGMTMGIPVAGYDPTPEEQSQFANGIKDNHCEEKGNADQQHHTQPDDGENTADYRSPGT